MENPGRRAGIWQARAALPRRDDRGGARRGRPLQAQPDGFRAVETLKARRAGVAVASRHRDPRTSRLAHRVLGHELEASRRNF